MRLRKEIAKMVWNDIVQIRLLMWEIFKILNKYGWEEFKKTRNVLADIEVEIRQAISIKKKEEEKLL